MAETDSTPLRTCTKCSLSKPYSEYTKVSRTKIGLSSQCKACQRIYYEANAERIKRTTLVNWNRRQEPKRAAKAEARAAKLALPTKRCGRCRETKAKSEFGVSRQRIDRLKPYCKPCNNQRNKEFRESNPESAKASSERWRKANMRASSERVSRWSATDKGKATKRAWLEARPGWFAEYYRERRKIPEVRVHHAIRSRIQSMVRNKNGKRTVDILGYCANELIAHLERQFLPGMSWNNYGAWHIDHIVPVSSFKVSSVEDHELRRAWALTNLRPLWAKDNIKKHAKRLFLI